jgi:predicted nucleic acid-binding protein
MPNPDKGRMTRVYLDMCTIQRPADDPGQLRVHLEAQAVLGIVTLVEQGKLELVWSDALVIEHEPNPHPERRRVTERTLSLASSVIPLTPAVHARAAGYRGGGMKAMDAVHLASAVDAGVEFFCTCDDRLLRRARMADTGLTRPVSPLELIQEVER